MYNATLTTKNTGLYYFNARWYDAGTGRFISEDPARDGSNWFVYVSNNPLKYIDPTGMYNVTNSTDYSFYMQYKVKYNAEGNISSDITYGKYSENLSESGCAVTFMSKAISALTGNIRTPADIASGDGNFSGGNLDWNNAASKYGLTAEKIPTNNLSYEDIKSMVERTAQSAQGYAYGVEVEFGNDSHYLNATGTKTIGGKEYVEIDPTSVNDPKLAGSGKRTGWVRKNGKLYVPIEKVKGIIVVHEDENKSPNLPGSNNNENDNDNNGSSGSNPDPYRNGMNDEPDDPVKRDANGNPIGL